MDRPPQHSPPAAADANSDSSADKRREQRRAFSQEIEFIGDFDVVEARGIDISTGGICFELDQPLPFDMKLNIDGEQHVYRACLAWMKSLEDGRCHLGFAFVQADRSMED